MVGISLKLLFAHWLAFLDVLQRLLWDYTPQPLLSTVFRGLIEDGTEFPPIVAVPRIHDPSDYRTTHSIDPSCLVPAVFETAPPSNLSCSIDRSNYNLYGAFLAESTYYHDVFLDIPVGQSVISDEGAPAVRSQIEDDGSETHMAPYGARGLSFCPVLVGLAYAHSLLHLYMFLMIPSLFNHWLDDASIYESPGSPIGGGMLDCAWFLYANLWTALWRLVRYGVRKVIACLHRGRRPNVSRQSNCPPLPRIVLIRADGKAVPVHFAEDCQAKVVDMDTQPPLESANLGVGHSRDTATLEDGDVLSSPVSGGDSCLATEFEALVSTRKVSHEGGRQGGIPEVQDRMELESLARELSRDPHLVIKVLEHRMEIPPVLVGTQNDPLESVGNEIMTLPAPDTSVTTGDVCNSDDGADNVHAELLEAMDSDVHQDDQHNFGCEDPDLAFSSWSILHERGPEESETSSQTIITGSSSGGSPDTPTPVKNVRSTTYSDTGMAHHSKGTFITDDAEEYLTWAEASEGPLGNDNVEPIQIPMVHSDPSKDVTSPEQAIQPALWMIPCGEEAEEINEFAQALSPSPDKSPVVNLPSLIAPREDISLVEMVPMVPAEFIENVATCSPPQILYPMVPAVVISMAPIIGTDRQGSMPLGAEGLDQVVFGRMGIIYDEATERGVSDADSLCEDGPCPPRPSIDDLHPVGSSVLAAEPLRAPTALWPSAVALETGTPAAETSQIVTNTSPRTTEEVPDPKEVDAETMYETPQYSLGEEDRTTSLQNEPQEARASVADSTSAMMHITDLETPEKSETGNQAGFTAVDNLESTISDLSGQPADFFVCAESPTTKPSEEKSTSLSKMTSPLPRLAEESRGSDTIPQDHLAAIPDPPPERTLSGFIHASSESLPTPYCTDQSVLYKTSSPITCSVTLAKANGSETETNKITENAFEHERDLFSSIHAPQRTSNAEMQSSVFSKARDEVHSDCQRSVTSPVAVSGKPMTSSGQPNWTAMSDVVDAFRMFRAVSSRNSIRGTASVAECMSRVPGIVGKGIATNSLNTANIQSRWTPGNRLLLVRDLMSSDPVDFNLRAW